MSRFSKTNKNLVRPNADTMRFGRWSIGPMVPFVKREPLPFRSIEPESDKAIVYPWLKKLAVWEELRFSLRSVAANFEDKECPIWIIGPEAPEWLKPDERVKFCCVNSRLGDKEGEMHEVVLIGLQKAREVVWMNDDIYFAKPCSFSDLRTALTQGRLDGSEDDLRRQSNIFLKGLGDACAELRAIGINEVWRFATHSPYLFEIEKSREVLKRFRLHYKGSFETLYHNLHKTPSRPRDGLVSANLADQPMFLNHGHRGPSFLAKASLEAMFPNPAPWEK